MLFRLLQSGPPKSPVIFFRILFEVLMNLNFQTISITNCQEKTIRAQGTDK